MKIGIIGGTGWIGSALGCALIETEILSASDLTILNRSGPRPDYFGHDVYWAKDCGDLVDRSEIVIVSVRPQDWADLGLDPKDRLVISVMAGVPISAITPRTIRAIPNAAAEIRKSYSPWVAGPDVTRQDRQTVGRILGAIGNADELTDEAQLDLMTALPGAGPAYPALLAVAMIRFLEDRDVPKPVAERATQAVICEAAQLLSGRMPEVGDIVQAYLDYNGTTAAGLREAERAGFSRAITAGLKAATERARSIGT
ncbi:pyrroline-5-carboxylate reductase family protein [Paracoccus aestuariivivens]|uniref:Pyrroline-5-carboxylate reductase n=1 Tax=Paracoccus aestuariivivens TaxID=1820333 RepID=A0A6L6JAN3_9RHOB|nr:pyrroline-5-carboxylate reductase dimerization domain-containing protein [Paracoccus aestuariivivens]MTH79060.1 NADP oxidoreductase [Paracoccus aestuariivivens]